MTDLSVSFLFIVLVLLAFFATQFRPEATVPRDEHETLAEMFAKVQAEIAWLRPALEERNRTISRLREAKDAARWRWTETLADRDRTIFGLREAAMQLQRELDAALTAARTLAVQIMQLMQSLDTAETERDAARETAQALTAEVERLKLRVADLEREVTRLRARAAELAAPDPLAVYLEGISSARGILLDRLAARIRRQLPGIQVTVIAADGVIRFRGDELFASGQWRIRPGSTADRVARAVGDALADTLPCYTVGARAAFEARCNGSFAAIETIQIEGHTDDVPISGPLRDRERMLDNRDLSARRGAETLRAATDRYRPELMEFLNLRGQPVLSFAGYGAMRPIARGDTLDARAVNRRIDIRFILQTPQNLREVEEIRERLTRNRPNLPAVANEAAP